jgi:hypothetical protein
MDSEGRLRTKLYDKRDDLNFSIVNFPFICSNIPTAPTYGVYISQLIRYPRAGGSYHDFLDRELLLWNICVTNDHGSVPFVVRTSRSFPHSWHINVFVTRLTRRMSLVGQELSSLPKHLCSPPVFSGVHVTRSLLVYVCFADRCLSFPTFSFGHCAVCSSSICEFCLPLWYLQNQSINSISFERYLIDNYQV